VTGNELLAQALRRRGVSTIYFLMGGPLIDAANACEEHGIRMIDARHEQAAAMMAHAHSRLENTPMVCMAASGPGTTNLVTGVANAFVDCAPVIAIGGSSDRRQIGRESFQELDQLSIMRPITRWAAQVPAAARIPEYVELAFQRATEGGTGPVYLDVPGDVLYAEVDPAEVVWREPAPSADRQSADPARVLDAVELLAAADRPIVISGSGILWSDATDQYRELVERLRIPFFTTPQGRGAIPEDHELLFAASRSRAFREADLVLVVATRLNWIVAHVSPPRFAEDAKVVQIDIDPTAIGRSRGVDIGLVGDARAVLEQLNDAVAGVIDPSRYAPWVERLAEADASRREAHEAALSSDATPIHPLRLCKEIRDVVERDAVLVVDGQEILNFGRQALPTFVPRHRLNSGPLGTMGVGLPFGIGAKVAEPDRQVIVVHGDGSMGLNAMELDTAVRHGINVVVVISNNGGWTATERYKAGRDLGYTRFDRMAEALGCHAEHVEQPEDLRPALERALDCGRPAVVNVVTDSTARAGTVAFTQYAT
jgi:acetolactate synthase-1/2/3 large subunit